MDLTDSSIERLAKGDTGSLPITLQILDIRRLNAEIDGTFVSRLRLSDGKYYYGGFVIDASALVSSHANLFGIIRINQLTALKHSQEKFVLQILEMQLVSQEDKCIGIPEPWFKGTNTVSTSVPINHNQCNTEESPIFQQPNNMVHTIRISELLTSTSTSAIEGVVTRKSEVCNFPNGTGKFFTFDLADMYSEIRCKAFNNIVNMFVDLIKIGQAYHLERFALTRSNKQYNHLTHDFEINLTSNSVLYRIPDHVFPNIHVSFNLVNISAISLADSGKCVDLFVSVKSVNEPDLIYVQKKNNHSYRRIVTVADDTGSIDVNLWNDFAKNFPATVNQNIWMKDLLIQNFKDFFMGNGPSDSLGHSFKRLRVSEKEQLSHISPGSISPKRKITLSGNECLNDISNESINTSIDRTPVILCNNPDVFSSSAEANIESSTIDNRVHFDKTSSYFDDHLSFCRSFTTCIDVKRENSLADVELSDEEIIMCLRSMESPLHLSDEDILDCLIQASAIKQP